MINRTLVRTKVIQTLFAYFQSEDTTLFTARKELLQRFSDTYSLYYLLLDLVNGLTTYAQEQMDEQVSRAHVTHQECNPNRRFVNNAFAQQLFENRRLRAYLLDQHLTWDAGSNAFAAVYKELVEQPYFQQYMQTPEGDYEADKTVWKKIFTHLIPGNEAVLGALEEMEIALDHQGWGTDLDVVASYVVKTIRQFKQDNGADQALMEMFDSEQELQFGPQLLQAAIEHAGEYREQIALHLKNWEAGRIAQMDRVILVTALAEIVHFPDLAVEISMNEYIELDKEFSGDKNYLFINGILTETLRDLKSKNLLIKPIR